MATLTINNAGVCEVPIINSLTVGGGPNEGKLVIGYTISETNLGSPEYQVATDINFTNIIYSRVGFNYTEFEVTPVIANNYPTLYVRARKHCTRPDGQSGTTAGAWSSIATWTLPTTTNMYITNNQIVGQGQRTFTLNVEDVDFVGYAITRGRRETNAKTVDVVPSPYGDPLHVGGTTPIDEDDFLAIPVNIPIGIYEGSLDVSAVSETNGFNTYGDGGIYFSPDMYAENAICFVSAQYIFMPM